MNLERYRCNPQNDHPVRRLNSADMSGSMVCNMLTGVVISRTQGLTRTTLRIRVGEQTDLRVRWPGSAAAYNALDVGQKVSLTIPEEAVQLEAGGFRRGKQRWNRWIGRVVLVDCNQDNPVTTVKLHRDIVTLKSRGPVIGSPALLKTWDTVNIVVDPQHIRLSALNQRYLSQNRSMSNCPTTSEPTSVWLRAAICSLRWGPAGYAVALNVGGVNLSALMDADEDALQAWKVGAPVEINISEYDAWVRLNRWSPLLRCRIAFASEAEVPRFFDK